LNNYCQKAMLYHHTVHSMLQLTLKKQLIGVCLFSISKRTRVASASAMMKRKVLFHLQSEDNQDAGKSKAKKRKEDNVKISDESKEEKESKIAGKLVELKMETADGRKGNIKIVSWNCAGLRAMAKKGGLKYLKQEEPDIVCFQETKCTEKDCPDEVNMFKHGLNTIVSTSCPKYHMYYSSAEKKGYSGTALWTKEKPKEVKYGLGKEKHDKEGRVITAEYEKFYLVTSYVPNSGKGLVRLGYRMEWEADMKTYLKDLEKTKPVIFCGDLNVAHEEIDIANPKSNVKNPGFSKEEREKFTELLDAGFVDSFRHLYPNEKDVYTFWSFMGTARERNIGWRLDYFVLSKSLTSSLCDSIARPSVMGSDHCPVVLVMSF